MHKTVLVALDYSKTDEKLLQKALELAKNEDTSIILLHVFSFFDAMPAPSAALYPETVSPALLKEWEDVEKESLTKLQEYVKQFEEVGITVTSQHILGHPAPVICTLARKLEIDTIIIGRSGRQGLAEAFLGSVSNYVFHHAPCSVWAIPAH
jgi:nucleotide-binding universal stress UspA family protein